MPAITADREPIQGLGRGRRAGKRGSSQNGPYEERRIETPRLPAGTRSSSLASVLGDRACVFDRIGATRSDRGH